MKTGISIKDISKQAGVSTATVSRIINKTGRYSKETEERVLRIIRENQYEPNLIARGLRVQKMKNVGIIVPDITNEFFMKLVYEIEKNLFAAGYETFLCNTDEDEVLERKRAQMMSMQSACGLIFLSGGSDMAFLKEDLPVVFIDRFPQKTSPSHCLISSDNVEGGYLATRELIQKGCRRILVLTSRRPISVYNDRFEGYVRALMENGMCAEDIHAAYLDRLHYQDAYEKMIQMLDAGEFDYDGVFAESDWLALGCFQALREHNIAVPEQVKIIGYDDISITAFNAVPLSTVRQQVDKIGKVAAEQLLRLIDGGQADRGVTRVPVVLVPRQSTAETK